MYNFVICYFCCCCDKRAVSHSSLYYSCLRISDPFTHMLYCYISFLLVFLFMNKKDI